jgi:hypothetical protein
MGVRLRDLISAGNDKAAGRPLFYLRPILVKHVRGLVVRASLFLYNIIRLLPRNVVSLNNLKHKHYGIFQLENTRHE